MSKIEAFYGLILRLWKEIKFNYLIELSENTLLCTLDVIHVRQIEKVS